MKENKSTSLLLGLLVISGACSSTILVSEAEKSDAALKVDASVSLVDAPITFSDASIAVDASIDGFDPNGMQGTFYAVGYAGLYMKSLDLGKTWVVKEDQLIGGDDSTLYRNIVWLNEKYFRVGNAGRGFWVSDDGENWEDHGVASNLKNWMSDVAFGNGRWLAAGGCGGTFVSNNGSSWTDRFNAVGKPGCEQSRSIAFGNTVFVVVGNNGASAFSAVTKDGVTFSDYQERTDLNWNIVKFAFGKFWVAKTDGSAILVSTDGITWDQASLPLHNYRVVSFTAGRLVLTTNNGVMLVSQNGSDFSSVNAVGFTNVAYGGGVWLGSSSGTLMRSEDNGVTWVNVNPTTHHIEKTIYAP